MKRIPFNYFSKQHVLIGHVSTDFTETLTCFIPPELVTATSAAAGSGAWSCQGLVQPGGPSAWRRRRASQRVRRRRLPRPRRHRRAGPTSKSDAIHGWDERVTL